MNQHMKHLLQTIKNLKFCTSAGWNSSQTISGHYTRIKSHIVPSGINEIFWFWFIHMLSSLGSVTVTLNCDMSLAYQGYISFSLILAVRISGHIKLVINLLS